MVQVHSPETPTTPEAYLLLQAARQVFVNNRDNLMQLVRQANRNIQEIDKALQRGRKHAPR